MHANLRIANRVQKSIRNSQIGIRFADSHSVYLLAKEKLYTVILLEACLSG